MSGGAPTARLDFGISYIPWMIDSEPDIASLTLGSDTAESNSAGRESGDGKSREESAPLVETPVSVCGATPHHVLYVHGGMDTLGRIYDDAYIIKIPDTQ